MLSVDVAVKVIVPFVLPSLLIFIKFFVLWFLVYKVELAEIRLIFFILQLKQLRVFSQEVIHCLLVRLNCTPVFTLRCLAHEEQDSPFTFAFTHELQCSFQLVLHSQEIHQTAFTLFCVVELVGEEHIRLVVQIIVGYIKGNENRLIVR